VGPAVFDVTTLIFFFGVELTAISVASISDADASGEQRIGGTNRVRFDWTNWDDRCRFRTLDDQEYELLWFTTRCLGCSCIFARKAQFILPLSYCSDHCRKRADRAAS